MEHGVVNKHSPELSSVDFISVSRYVGSSEDHVQGGFCDSVRRSQTRHGISFMIYKPTKMAS